ncbi:hypothetical protein [Lysobacter sp. F60174L2]|uniref:hypothetical protein n=1 Tax=Lysobacter sp. F60174L2 TaxID=3459295 RepID=UPI00403D7B6A
MKKLAVTIGSLLLMAPAVGGAQGRTHDGRYSSSCYPSHNNTSKADAYCESSIVRLIARPEEYHDKHIRVTGFLIRQSGIYVLFPGRSFWMATRGTSGVELLTGEQIPADIRALADGDGVDGVRITGRFDARSPARASASAGLVTDVEAIFVEPLFPH